MTADTTTTNDRPNGTHGRLSRSRRGLLAGAAGALGVLAADTIAPARPAGATPPPVLLGTDNIGATSRTGVFTTGNKEWGILGDPGTSGLGSQGVYGAGENTGVRGESATGAGVIGRSGITGGTPPAAGTGVLGLGAGTGYGVAGIGGTAAAGATGGAGVHGTGGSSNGTGVAGLGVGTGPGVVGDGGAFNGTGVIGTGGGAGDGVAGSASTGNGVRGTATAAAGLGVLAENTAGGIALQVTGRAKFNRSGLLTVPAGKSSATQTGVTLTAASLVLATLQQNLSGVYVRSAVPNVAGNSFIVYLSKAPSASAKVAWFIVN